jgi:hypothetical protein
MASRRWIDTDILAKIGGGLLLVALSAGAWFGLHRFWPWGWVMGGILLCWGLFSIGDSKNEWE